jgi:hypothetical protein
MKTYRESVISSIVFGHARLCMSVRAKADYVPADNTGSHRRADWSWCHVKRLSIQGSAMYSSDYRLDTLHGDGAFFPGRTHVQALTSQSLALCLLVILTSFDLFPQTASTGALTGTVFDPAGAVVSNAAITLHNNGTRQTFTDVTDPSGIYRFTLLPPGKYELTVEAVGFAPIVLLEVMIEITEVRRIPIKLVVRSVPEVVEVIAPLLQTEDAALGRVIDQGTIVALPLVNRNYTQILGLTAGTNTDVDSRAKAQFQSIPIARSNSRLSVEVLRAD